MAPGARRNCDRVGYFASRFRDLSGVGCRIIVVRRKRMKLAIASRRYAVLTLLAFVLAVNVAGSARVFRCVGDGVVRSACCCPSEAAPVATGPTVSRACCCDVSEIKATVVVAETKSPGATVPPPLVTVLATPALGLDGGQSGRAGTRALAPRPPVPILLHKHSLLI